MESGREDGEVCVTLFLPRVFSHLCHGLDLIVLESTNLEETWFFFHRKLDDRVNCASSFGWCRQTICHILIFVSWYGRKLSHGLLLLIGSTYQHVVGNKQLENYWTSIQAMMELVKLMTGDSRNWTPSGFHFKLFFTLTRSNSSELISWSDDLQIDLSNLDHKSDQILYQDWQSWV